MEKRGLSDIVSTVLIILLVVGAVAIIGVIVLNVVHNTGDSITNSMVCQNAEITPTNCVYNSSSYYLTYDAKLDTGNSIASLSLNLQTKEGKLISINVSDISSMVNLERRAYSNDSNDNLTNFRTSYVIKSKDGSLVNCQSPIKLTCVGGEVSNLINNNPVIKGGLNSNLTSPADSINITECQTITQPGNYALVQNISSSEDCLIINSNDVFIYGNGHTITGNVNGSGVNIASDANAGIADSGYSFNLINVIVNGNVISNGADNPTYSNSGGHAGNGGNVSILSSIINEISSNGGSNAGLDGFGGSGGTITIISSIVGNINSNSGTGSLVAQQGDSGNGGIINISSSTYGILNVLNSPIGGYGSAGSIGRVYIDGSLASSGCNDIHALNYNSSAKYSDGSCYYHPGCTDASAFNYDPSADHDNGSCIPIVWGCTDNNSFNYDPSANRNDGSCFSSLITSCETLSTSGTYQLNQNIGTGSDCLIINGSNITINGNGHTITGNVNGSGVNQGDSGYSFSLINISVSGIIESIGSDGYNAGNGGMINISSSSTGDISVAGGNALGGYGGTGGNGGIINLTSSNYGALSAYAGSGGGYGTSGSVGQIYIDGVLH